jgi:hypothetical protein
MTSARPRSSLLVLAALVALLPAIARAQWQPAIDRPLGSGWHSNAYLLKSAPPGLPNHLVMKVYKAVLSNGQHRGQAEIAQLVAATVRDNRALKAHPDFQPGGRFGNIVPDALPFEGDKLLLTFRPGVRIDQLSGNLQAGARAELRSAVAVARSIISHPDDNEANFLFDPHTGKLTGWPDPGWGH